MAGKEFFKSGIESFRLFGVAVFGALTVTGAAPARAQTPVIRRIGNDSVVVIAGEIYRAGSLHRKLLGDTTVCGMSSSLVQVTVVPAFTFSSCGPKVKFPILTATSAASAGGATRRSAAATPAMKDFVSDLMMIMIALNPAAVCR